MQTKNTDQNKKGVLILVNNEIVLKAVKKTLEGMGYEIHQDVESCKSVDFGFICSYFARLGTLNQLRTVNYLLPLILVVSADHKLDGNSKSVENFYDVIKLDSHNETDIKQKITRWFSEGQGKFLIKGE